jgi:hypothetical protein
MIKSPTLVTLDNLDIIESSGICRSVRHQGVYWTHNDSSNATTLFAFDETGADLGAFPLGVKGIDCEDISSALVRGIPTIILADVGDNACTRKSYCIYVVTEPEPLTPGLLRVTKIPFMYPDGKSRNCEAVNLLPSGSIVLTTKNYPSKSGPTTEFTIASWLSGAKGTVAYCSALRDARLGTITASDNREGVDILMGNGKTYVFADSTKPRTLTRTVTMPKDVQPEAVCLSHDGKYLLMTSETNKAVGATTPLHFVAL